MKKITLADTGLLPEKKEILNALEPINQGYNDALTKLGEIDLSAWLKENGWMKIEDYQDMVTVFRAKKEGYIKLSDVELDVEKIKLVVMDYFEKTQKYYDASGIAQAIADSKPFKEKED